MSYDWFWWVIGIGSLVILFLFYITKDWNKMSEEDDLDYWE